MKCVQIKFQGARPFFIIFIIIIFLSCGKDVPNTVIVLEGGNSWPIYEKKVYGKSTDKLNSVIAFITSYGEGPKFFDVRGDAKIYEVWADVRYNIQCGIIENVVDSDTGGIISSVIHFSEFFSASSPLEYRLGVNRSREVLKQKILGFLLSEVKKFCVRY